MIAPEPKNLPKGVVNLRTPSLNNVKVMAGESPAIPKMPKTNFNYNGIEKPKVKFGYVDPNSKDYRAVLMSTGIANTNAMNMALSCRVLNVSSYSSPPISSMNALQVIQGYARDQPRGLAYSKGHPLNSRLLNMSSNFYGNMPNPINP